MTERPIIFSGPRVQAIFDGRKTQTRRVLPSDTMKSDAIYRVDDYWQCAVNGHPYNFICRYGQPSDRLWVRESFAVYDHDCPTGPQIEYRASPICGGDPDAGWKRSIHMPRKYCRLFLDVKAVRVERLQDISKEDARAEGVQVPVDQETKLPLLRITGNYPPSDYLSDPALQCTDTNALFLAHFASLWDSLNAKRGHGWDTNPFVWVIEFERATGHDQ